MKTLKLALLLSLFAMNLKAQEANKNDEEVLTFVEQEAEFVGGVNAMIKYLAENIKYPDNAVKNNIQGKVYIRFIVDKAGNINTVKVIKGIPDCPECDAEAVRVIKGMPKWNPAMQNGKPVNM